MILQVVSPTKLFSKTAAVPVHAFPVLPGDLVDAFFVAFAVVGGCEALGAGTVLEAAVVDFEVLLVMSPGGLLV